MERLTTTFGGKCFPHGAEGKSVESLTGNYCRGKFEATALVERLCEIEDILFDENGKERISFDRLKELIQADAEGLLHKFPCEVGDTVYQIMIMDIDVTTWRTVYQIFEAKIFKFTTDLYTTCFWTETTDLNKHQSALPFRAMGETVFLTREAAEAALKKMGGVEE